MDRDTQARFDALLAAMAAGEAPSARKKASDAEASGEASDACCDDTQIHPDTSKGDAS